MDINFNLGFLKTVKAPVADSFKSAQEGIKDALSSAKAGAHGGFNFTFMKDFSSTQSMFKMIGLHGLYEVTGLVIEVLTAVREGKLESEKLPHILSMTNETVRNLSFYVEQLLQGGADQPLSLYADYEKLAKFINKEVAQKDLFFPRLDWEDKSLVLDLVDFFKPARVLSVEESKAMYSEISAQRLIVQRGIADVFPLLEKLNDPSAAKVMHDKCRIMFDALNKAQGIKFNKSYYLLGLLQKLFVCSISPNLNDKISQLAASENRAIKHALAKLEKELKTVCQALNENIEGEFNGNLKPANIRPEEETVRDLLFFLSSVVKLNPKFKEIQIYKEVAKVFPLDFYLKQLSNLSFSVTTAQKNPEILAQLEKVFSETKEEVVMMTSKAGGSFDQIFAHINKLAAFLARVDELFNSLNVSSLQPTTQALLAAVGSIKNKQAQFTHEVAAEMSLLVVMLENGINDYVKAYAPENDYIVLSHQLGIQIARLNFALNNRLPELEQAQSPEMDARSRKSDERKAFESVFHELSQNFAHVEEMLDEFFRSNGENLVQLVPRAISKYCAKR